MMQRLRDQIDSTDPAIARAAELLAAVPPLDEKRVRAWARAPVYDRTSLRPPLARIRAGVVFALMFASLGATAETAHRRGWIAWFRSAPVAPSDAPVSATRVKAEHAPRVVSPIETAKAPPAPAPAFEPVTPRREVREPGGGASGESVLMVQAVRALRRDGDPARAQALAEETLRRYPRGAQSEEAMALVMEAAAVRGDLATARRAAARYLERYAHGRFADRAHRVVSGSKDGD